MPAGDGATRVVSAPTCQWCGADLVGEIRVGVDVWCTFACPTCDDEHTAPDTCVVYRLPRLEAGDEEEAE